MSRKSCAGIAQGDIVRAAEYLNHCLVLIQLDYTSKLFFFVVHCDFYNFFKCRAFNALNGNEGAVDIT